MGWAVTDVAVGVGSARTGMGGDAVVVGAEVASYAVYVSKIWAQ